MDDTTDDDEEEEIDMVMYNMATGRRLAGGKTVGPAKHTAGDDYVMIMCDYVIM